MSEFDNWRKNYFPKAIKESPVDWAAWSVITKDCWIAALKWVLNHPDLIDHYQLDYVKEELKEVENER